MTRRLFERALEHVYAAGLVPILLVSARPAHAQDVTPLVVALLPPLLLAPPCLALARWLWLRKDFASPSRIVLLFAASCVEVVLWIVFGVSSVALMTGDWTLQAIPVFLFTGGGLWVLSRMWFDPSRKAARRLWLASPPLALGILVVATWLVIVAAAP